MAPDKTSSKTPLKRKNNGKKKLHQSTCNGHISFECLSKMFEEKRFCDVVLVVDNKEIAANSIVLSACSLYFYNKLSRERKPQNRVGISNIDYKTLSTVVEYFYTGNIAITETSVACLLRAAYMFALSDLQKACQQFISDNIDKKNCLEFATLARECQSLELATLADAYVSSHLEKLIKSTEFLDLPFQRVVQLIQSKTATSNPKVILDCVLLWVNSDLNNRRKYVFILLDFVNFPQISITDALLMLDNELWMKHDPQYDRILAHIMRCYSQKLLQNNLPSKVMAVVGTRDSDMLHMEMYNFGKGTWNYGPSAVNVGPVGYSLTTMAGLNVYVHNNSDMRRINMNNSQGIWMKCKKPSYDHSVSCIAGYNKYVYVVYTSGEAEVYNEESRNWRVIAPMSSANIDKMTLAIYNGRLYSVGGVNDNNQPENSVQCYSPDDDSWFHMPKMLYPRLKPGVAVSGDKLFVVGGSIFKGVKASRKVEAFDFEDSSWKLLPPMNVARGWGPGVIATNGLVYVIGGTDNDNRILNSIEIYDPKTNTWSMLPQPMDIGKYNVTVTLIDEADIKLSCTQ